MRPRLLLVDDHEIVRKGIRQLLEGPTLEVCGEASNGEEAIQKVLTLKPDIVVMDYLMPGLNGIEVLRTIREIAPSTKIVILTMDDAAVEHAKDAGADACVHKGSLVAGIASSCYRHSTEPRTFLRSAIHNVIFIRCERQETHNFFFT